MTRPSLILMFIVLGLILVTAGFALAMYGAAGPALVLFVLGVASLGGAVAVLVDDLGSRRREQIRRELPGDPEPPHDHY